MEAVSLVFEGGSLGFEGGSLGFESGSLVSEGGSLEAKFIRTRAMSQSPSGRVLKQPSRIPSVCWVLLCQGVGQRTG